MSLKFRVLRSVAGLVLALAGGFFLAWVAPANSYSGCISWKSLAPDGQFLVDVYC